LPSETSLTSLGARLARLRHFADRPAYFWKEGVRWRRRTYAALHDRIGACAQRLAREGVDAPVLIQGPGHPAWVEALAGVLLAGGVAVPLEESAPDAFREEVARRCKSRLLVAPAGISPPPGCRRIEWDSWGDAVVDFSPAWADPPGDRTAEIVFTSGTTGQPRGVVLTHRNLASDFAPIERAFERWEPWIRPLGPLPFLTTLPLAHMFGQAMNVFLPLFMGLSVAFVPPRPAEVREAARRLGAWGLFSVPRLLDLLGLEVRSLLRDAGVLEKIQKRQARFDRWPFIFQAFLFPRVAGIFGPRFRLLVSGGAPLSEEVQRFWESFGYLVIQGYGLTETAPIVSISNPFDRRGGGVGRPLAIQEVSLGREGEILVRGPNVTQGYFGEEAARDAEGWLRTGDVGELDPEGRLRIRGRLKDVIVTPEGENVFPADVEAALRPAEGVREACVVGISEGVAEHVHAVLLMEKSCSAEAAVVAANERLQPRQRIRDFTVWSGSDFPRTSTGKVKKGLVREEVLRRAQGGEGSGDAFGLNAEVRRLVAQVARSRMERLGEGTLLAEALGLSSLDLVELGVRLEERFGVVLADEALASATVGELERAVGEAAGREPARPEGHPASQTSQTPGAAAPILSEKSSRQRLGALRMPRWTRVPPFHQLRRLLEEAVFRPIVLLQARPEVAGLERLGSADPPYLFVCNHRSYLDTGLFKAILPRPLRGRIAPAMTTRHHRVFFGETGGSRARYALESIQVRLVELLFGAWPLPETAGFRRSLGYAGELADAGFSLLVFPEGRHVPAGGLAPFRGGIGILARELRATVVPAWVEGTARVLPDGARWMRRGRTRLVLGEPLRIDPDADPAETTRRLEMAVRRLEDSGSGPPG
jgi:long-chain acyl-CoA synthetase